MLGFSQEAVKRGGLCARHPAGGSIPETSPLGHIAKVRSMPQGQETHHAPRESLFLLFQTPKILSDQIPEPNLAPDFSSLIPYVRSAAFKCSPCSPIGSWRRSKPVATARGTYCVLPRGRTAPETNGRSCTYDSKGKNEFLECAF